MKAFEFIKIEELPPSPKVTSISMILYNLISIPLLRVRNS
jgi:hypothetical protein